MVLFIAISKSMLKPELRIKKIFCCTIVYRNRIPFSYIITLPDKKVKDLSIVPVFTDVLNGFGLNFPALPRFTSTAKRSYDWDPIIENHLRSHHFEKLLYCCPLIPGYRYNVFVYFGNCQINGKHCDCCYW